MLVPSHGARRVGRYLLCDQIGSGGMATIHLARLLGPQGFSRTVAVKQLHPQFAQNPQFVAMLLDEARLAVRVRHVNVVSPLDVVATERELFIVMDYVNGESLANLLAASQQPLKPAFAAAIMVQVLLGLHAAHEATREQGDALGLVHRDVSPQNILVGQDGVTRMVDFGIAKAVARTQTTDGGMVKGKLGYMAPEQLRLEAIDRRTDLFSAGVVLWEALTGTGLFVSDTLGGSIESILHGEIAPPSRHNPAVPPELDAVVLKALTRDRAERFQDAMSMAAALERATPLASALELIEWVCGLAGPELERRAELVKRAEAESWEAVREVRSPLGSSSIEPSLSRARTGWTETVEVCSKPLHQTPTLLGIAKPQRWPAPTEGNDNGGRVDDIPAEASAPAATVAPLATRESTGVAVGGDRLASASSEGSGDPGWKSRWLALGIVLAGIATAALSLTLSGGESESSLAIGRARPSIGRAGAIEVVAAGLEPSGAATPPAIASPRQPAVVPAPSESASGASLESAPVRAALGVAADAASSARARPARAGRSDRASASRRPTASSARRGAAGKKAEAPAKRNEPAPSHGTPPQAVSDRCTPPWVINAEQVKVFKAECLR